jgi:hypothetical protein
MEEVMEGVFEAFQDRLHVEIEVARQMYAAQPVRPTAERLAHLQIVQGQLAAIEDAIRCGELDDEVEELIRLEEQMRRARKEEA